MKKLFFLTLGIFIFLQIAAQKNTEIQASQLPQLTQDYLKDFMPDSKIYKAYKVVDQGEVSYAVGVLVNNDKRILIFDQDGKFVKKGDRREGARVKQDLQKQQQETGKEQQNMTPPVGNPNTVKKELNPSKEMNQTGSSGQPQKQPVIQQKSQTIRQGESKSLSKPKESNQNQQSGQSIKKTETKQLTQPQQQMQTKQSGQSIKKTETNQLAKPQQQMQTNQEIKTIPKK